MKIAISAAGDSMQSPFEPRFGRAPGFMIYDTETGKSYYLDNSDQQGLSQGAGIQTAQKISEQGVQALITGNIGPKASATLAQTDIKIFSSSARTVAQALEEFESGRADSGDSVQQPSSSPGTGLGRGPGKGGRGMGGGARGRGPGQGGRGMGGGAKGRGSGQGGRGMGGGGQGGKGVS
ncbi:MAG: NifB/NifX family molybdenum-iron cluster-binding protein [Thermodesulfobacteriota bacterium]